MVVVLTRTCDSLYRLLSRAYAGYRAGESGKPLGRVRTPDLIPGLWPTRDSFSLKEEDSKQWDSMKCPQFRVVYNDQLVGVKTIVAPAQSHLKYRLRSESQQWPLVQFIQASLQYLQDNGTSLPHIIYMEAPSTLCSYLFWPSLLHMPKGATTAPSGQKTFIWSNNVQPPYITVSVTKSIQ